MKIRILIVSFILFALSACATASPAPTATLLPLTESAPLSAQEKTIALMAGTFSAPKDEAILSVTLISRFEDDFLALNDIGDLVFYGNEEGLLGVGVSALLDGEMVEASYLGAESESGIEEVDREGYLFKLVDANGQVLPGAKKLLRTAGLWESEMNIDAELVDKSFLMVVNQDGSVSLYRWDESSNKYDLVDRSRVRDGEDGLKDALYLPGKDVLIPQAPSGFEAELDETGRLVAVNEEGNQLKWDGETGEWVEVVRLQVAEDGLVHLLDENGLGISYDPEKMYGGEVMINPEKAGLLRERYINLIWVRNNLVKNPNFMPGGRYDTFEKFLEAANEGEVSGLYQFESYSSKGPWGEYIDSVPQREQVNLDLREIEFEMPVIVIEHMIPEFEPGVAGLIPTIGKYGATMEMVDKETGRLTVRLIIKMPGEVNPNLSPDRLERGLNNFLNSTLSMIVEEKGGYRDGIRYLLEYGPRPDDIGILPSDFLKVVKNPELLDDGEIVEDMGLSEQTVSILRSFLVSDVFMIK